MVVQVVQVMQGSPDELEKTTLAMPAEANGSMAPRASLVCRPNSHPFQDRMLSLDQPVKVGRSVARARPIQTNAIFDCKVLSRNHALLWYENGKFYLQDTKSSNGTFVNNQRLSKGSEESPPREVCSGDILQFGVDVMENSRKVTHGCIIATLKLFLPDGKEAKASPTIVSTAAGTSIPTQELYQLNQYIQEALAREQLLENKLTMLQRLVAQTEAASQEGWKALMDEDRLLTRVEILESQLTTYGKSMTEDKLREEAKRLMEDKESYQKAAKDSLKKLVDEKLDALKRLKDVETSLGSVEDEQTSLQQLYERTVEENRRLSEKVTSLNDELAKKQKSLDEAAESVNEADVKKESYLIENSSDSLNESLTENGTSNNSSSGLNGKLCDKEDQMRFSQADRISQDMAGSTDSLDGTKPDDLEVSDKTLELNKLVEETQRLKCVLDELQKSKAKTDNEMINLRLNLEEAKNENSIVLQELENTRNKLVDAEQLIESQDKLVKDLEERIEENSFSKLVQPCKDSAAAGLSPAAQVGADRHQLVDASTETVEAAAPPPAAAETDTTRKCAIHTDENSSQCSALRRRVQELERENAQLQELQKKHDDAQQYTTQVPTKENVAEALNVSASSGSDFSALEMSLSEAEDKIYSLLKLKEKLVTLQADNTRLEEDVSCLEEELSTLSVASRSLTACTVIPIIVILIAIVTAFLPSVSSLFGTKDS